MANNTYLFYGDKDEIVKCHKALNDIYEDVGSDTPCVEQEAFITNAEWINYIDDINPGVDDRFYMSTRGRWYGNPNYWYNWVKANFPKLSVAFRCEEYLMGIFNQIDPDNELPDVVWVYGHDISADDLSKLPLAIRERAGKYTDSTYYVAGTFDRDELFNSNFKPADLPKRIIVREYHKSTYGEYPDQDAKFRVFDDALDE